MAAQTYLRQSLGSSDWQQGTQQQQSLQLLQQRPLSPALTNPDLLLPDIASNSGDGSSKPLQSAPPVFQRPPSPSQIIRKNRTPQTSRPHPVKTGRLNWANVSPPESRSKSQQHLYPSTGRSSRTPPLSRPSSNLAGADEHATPTGAGQRQQRNGNETLASSPTLQDGLRRPSGESQQPHDRRWSTTSSSVKSDDFESLESLKWPGFDEQIARASAEDDDSLVLDDDGEEERFGSFPDVQGSEVDGGAGGSGVGSGGPRTASESDDSAALSRRADIILANAKKRLHVSDLHHCPLD
jgi:hypothetical protein